MFKTNKDNLLVTLLLSFTLILSSSLEANQLRYRSVVDIADHKGQTFFALMQNEIKPALDTYATEGFKVRNGSHVVRSLTLVDDKVARKALRAAGSEENLAEIADQLSQQAGLTFYDLPEKLAELGVGAGRYDLTTFLALVSGGGVAVKINPSNYAYNVNYGTGEMQHDEKTGRSFGEAPDRLALDASDKHYLQILEDYVRSEGEDIQDFYLAIMKILLNNDTSHYSKISEAGQAVGTDFLAVYIAEQNRHLMVDLQTHHWDEALLEVTLLSAFHAGQRKLMVMYNGELTDTTHQQTPGCQAAQQQPREKKASMIDYWQFSTSTDPANCNRSGINITRRDFRSLGQAISDYEREHNPELVEKVERHFNSQKQNGNLFAQLSAFLINFETPTELNRQQLQLAADFTEFLMQVRRDANKISQSIQENQ